MLLLAHTFFFYLLYSFYSPCSCKILGETHMTIDFGPNITDTYKINQVWFTSLAQCTESPTQNMKVSKKSGKHDKKKKKKEEQTWEASFPHYVNL